MSKKSLQRLNTRLSVLAVTLAIAGMPLDASAAGLGRITVLSALGQPLRAEIELTASREEMLGMVARVAAPDAFKLAGLDYANTLSALRFSIETRGAQSYVVLTSDRPIRDPFVDMLIELNWSAGRMVREYTFLLDPPETISKSPAMAMPPPAKAATPPAVESTPFQPATAASGAMAPVAKGAAASGPESVEVKRGDTLNAIASATKPDGVSLEQMLVGLYRANPDAFDGNNMNRLRAGKILSVPDAVDVAAIAPAEARREIRVQVADWNAYKRKLAGAASQMATRDEVAGQSAEGKITPKVDAPAAPGADARDQVKVSKTQREGAAPGVAGEEQKVAETRAVEEANARVAELERNVADLQKMLELKQQGAAAPAPAGSPGVPDKPAEAMAKAPDAAPVMAPPPAPAAQADEPVKPKPKAPPPPPPPETSIVDDVLDNPAALGGVAGLIALLGGWFALRRRKAAQSSEQALPLAVNTLSPSSLGANSVFRATGGQSVDTSNVTPATTDFSQAGPGVIDTDEVDPVAEAEVYMAYGRDAQAEEILIEALAKDNKRVSIHLKLLEIYAARKSLKPFETIAGELYAVTGGAGPEWEKAAAMGTQLDAGNPLYTRGPGEAGATAGGVATAAALSSLGSPSSSPEVAATPAGEPAAREGAGFDFDLGIQALSNAAEPAAAGSGYRFDFEFDEETGNKPAAGEVVAQADASPPEVQMDGASAPADEVIALAETSTEGLPAFDFDLSGAATPTPASGESAGAALPEAALGDLDLPGDTETDVGAASLAGPAASDFALEFPETDTLAMPPEPVAPLPEVADALSEQPATLAEAPAATDDIALDFDLGLDEQPAEAASPAPDGAVSEMHEDLQIPMPAEAPADAADAGMPKLNLAGLSLDLDTPAPAPAPEYDGEATLFEPLVDDTATVAMPEPVASDVADSFDLESVAPQAAPTEQTAAATDDPRWQEVATKLDLAQAYEEMGDAEGARELLDEVMAEGNAAQQASAREMLARLG